MVFNWTPTRSLKECAEILEGPDSQYATEEAVIKGRHLRVYKRLPPSLRALWLSTQAFAGNTYICYGDERYTYSQTHERVAALCALLQSHGVTKGSRVAVSMRNLPEFIFLIWATTSLGAIIVAVNAWNPFEALKHCISNADPDVIFLDPERAQILAPVLSDLKANGTKAVYVVRAKNVPAGFLPFDPAVDPFVGARYPEVNIVPEDPATIFFTSGTQSLPKGVLSTQRQVLTNLFNSSLSAVRADLRRGEGLPQPDPKRPQRGVLLAIPLFHVTGCHSYLVMTTAAGGKVVLMHKWSTPDAVALLKKERITTAGGVPYIALELLEALKGDPDHFVEGLSFGGAPAPAAITELLQKNVGTKVSISQAYGMTETNAVIAGHAGEDYLARPKSTGLVTPVNEIKIRDLETEEELPTGATGEIYVRGPNVAEGYWKDPKASKVFRPDGWYQTGDVGHLDAEGFLYISDRAKEIIIRGGENISTVGVEHVLHDHPSVKEVAVVPVPDEKLGELVAAIVVLKPVASGPSEADLQAFAAERLPKHAVPVVVWVRSEDLPRNASGKILKNVLKKEMLELWQQKIGSGKVVKAKL